MEIIDSKGRRKNTERRQTLETVLAPDKRSGDERRNSADRRSGTDRRSPESLKSTAESDRNEGADD